MLKQNSELRAEARQALSGRWMMAVVATIIYGAITGGLSAIPGAGGAISLLVGLPVAYGFANALRELLKSDKEVDLGSLFDGFKDYGRILGTVVLQFVYTVLWTLLLVIPGIIKGYSYSMTYYILKDNPELRNNAAIEKSMAMMNGNKMKLFLLDLSFIGWFFLSILTLGIGFLFLQPYVSVAHAAFYEDLKAQNATATAGAE
ncbi:MAG: DUF975 family protein [Mediterranea sp.]|nr:DUF975 family protein [Mediterranea sp.]